jgi:rhodanese-related sulfurtransferase
LCAKALGEMGFTDVWVIEGGCRGWKEAGYDVTMPPQP